jgi:hypothetical protein
MSQDKTDESQKAWIKSVLSKNYVCLKPMEGYRDIHNKVEQPHS